MIQLNALERQFTRGEATVNALREVDLSIAVGEFVALVGPSGSGKSTLLNLLGGLDRPTGGELWVGDLPLHTANAGDLTRYRKQRIGFIFQSFNLLPRLTATENVALPLMLAGVPRAEREARAQAMLTTVGLGHRLDHYPTELSGGEQQRTAIARALVHAPQLILADEPTGNLDSATGEAIMDLLRRLNREQGITLIVVTHDAEVAGYADRIVRLRDGQIVAIEQADGSTPVAGGAVTANGTPRTGSGGRLTFGDIARSALSNLGRRPVRNILTAAGVLIGIVTLVAMVSFGVGVQREVQRNFESIGLENLFVSPRFAQQDGFDPFAQPEPELPLTPDLVAQIAALPDVVSVVPSINLPTGLDVTLRYGDINQPIFITDGGGTPFRFGPPTASGMLAGQDVMQVERGILLVRGLADQLLTAGESYDALIGRDVTLTARLPRGETTDFVLPIVGVQDGFATRTVDVAVADRVALRGWWFGDPDFLAREGYDSLTVRAASLGAITPVSDAIEALGAEVQSIQAILDVANQVLALLQALLGSVGGLALLVAALGVANTMMMAIYERTREIGILKALGASGGEIRGLFTAEAALIGVLGGIAGLIVGTLLGRVVDWIGQRYLINEGVTGVGTLSIVPWWLAVGAVIFAALIGLLAGLYPAARAARLDPVAALRHE